MTAAKGIAHLGPLLERIQADESLPPLARELFAIQAKDLMQLQAQIGELNAKLMTWHRADECSRRLAKIPSVGPIGAVLLTHQSVIKTTFLLYFPKAGAILGVTTTACSEAQNFPAA